jgi:Polyketide cyclase / dehydrase and lipid transport
MAEGSTETTIAREPAAVWAVVRDFGGLEGWMPGIESCVVEGDDRVLGLIGISVRERLTARDDDKRTLTYSIVESPMNLEHHEATIRVDDAPGGSHVAYDVAVSPDQMLDILVQTYGQALAALKDKVES